MRQSAWLVALAILGLAVSGGCTRHGGRRPIQGEVTLDGKPASGAVISFQAVTGSQGNSSGAVVDEQGRFSIPAAKGLMPGTYSVSIQWWKETGRTFQDPRSGEYLAITAPVEYAEKGKLQITVAADASARFSFPLTSSNH